jgi:hypothetical protein
MFNHPFWSDLNSTHKKKNKTEKRLDKDKTYSLTRIHIVNDRHRTQKVKTQTRNIERRQGQRKKKGKTYINECGRMKGNK